MPRSVLEEIRLLTNFETAQQKLVQIVLVGQPELDKKLDSVELRSLKQRIAVRCRLEPLRAEEVRSYIEQRLEIAGADRQAASTIFPVATVKAVYRYSAGLPRLINNICDQAMMGACASQVRVVPAEMIDEIASRFRLEPVRASKPGEALFTPGSQGERLGVEIEKPRPAVPAPTAAPAAPIAPSANGTHPETVLLYVDLEQGAAAQGSSASQVEGVRKSVVREDVPVRLQE